MDMEFRNSKLELDLKCHAPIIHFQPEEEGATLRASEVKPKFDRYLIKKVPSLKKRFKNQSLAYKMKFIDNSPSIIYKSKENKDQFDKRTNNNEGNFELYFARDGKRRVETNPTMIITCFDIELQNLIIDHIKNFFIVTNFGAAQGKGYGSFTVNDKEQDKQDYQSNIEAVLKEEFGLKTLYKMDFRQQCSKLGFSKRIKVIFENIEQFYKIIKSGYNYKGKYARSALFMYMHDKEKNLFKIDIGNEKAALKDKIIEKPFGTRPYHLNKQTHNEKYVRALLGLSSYLSFTDIRKNTKKEEKDISVNIDIMHEANKIEANIERFSSPITFKVINDIVYIIPKQRWCKYILNKKFKFKYKVSKKIPRSWTNGIEYKKFLISKPKTKKKEFIRIRKEEYAKFIEKMDKKLKRERLYLTTPEEFDLLNFLDFAVQYYNKENSNGYLHNVDILYKIEKS